MAKVYNLNLSRINNNIVTTNGLSGDSPSVPRKKMAFRVRSSKYRHVYGNPAKKEQCYEGVKITKNAHDSNFCAVNPKFVALVTESAGGGAFLVIPVDKVGRVDINSPKVCGHSGPVLDIKWNPFNDHIIASSSDDATIKLWQVPEGGLQTNLTEWLIDLHGHTRRVGYIEWHPTAENILLSAGYDFKCILWNTEIAEPINIISVHSDTIFSIAWNKDGSLFASTCKDKKIRIIEPREGKVITEGAGHQGSKASKVVFLGERNRLFTTGFSRMSERQYGIWDTTNLSKALKIDNIDSSSGVMIPFYDCDTKVVFLAGKGDGNIRYYELVDDAPYIHYLSQYQSGSPQRGLGIMPKRGIEPSKCEIVRFYKLHTAKSFCEPISMIVPRKSEMFQDDIYPPTASACPSLTADEWISGQNREPILISLKDGQICTVPKYHAAKAVRPKVTPASTESSSSIPVLKERRKAGDTSQRSKSADSGSAGSGHARAASAKFGAKASVKSSKIPPKSPPKPKSAPPVRAGRVSEIRRQFSKKDGALCHTPTITTYKAVKRGSSGTELMSNKRAASPNTKTSSGPEKLPASVKNIKKLSSLDNEAPDNNNTQGDVSNRISIFEAKRNMKKSEATTRLTNDNEPMRVDKKVWTSAYTSPSVTNEVPNVNGTPKTDPERHPSELAQPRKARGERPSWQDHQDKENDNYYSPPEGGVASSAFVQIGSGRRAQSFRGETRKASSMSPNDLFNRKGSMKEASGRKPQGATTARVGGGTESRRSRLSTDSFVESGALNESFGTNESLGSEGSDRFVTPPVSPLRPSAQVSVTSQARGGGAGPGAGAAQPSAHYSYEDEADDDLWNDNPLYSRGKYRKPTRRRQREREPKRHTTDGVPNMSVDMTPLDDILQDFEESARALQGGKPKGMNFTSGANIQLSPEQRAARAIHGGGQNVSQVNCSARARAPDHNGAFSPTKDDSSSSGGTATVNDGAEFVMLDGNSSASDAMIDCISKEAPDDTLIKPSKLRASMRTRKERAPLRGGSGIGGSFRQREPPHQSRSNTELSGPPRGSLSPDIGRLMGSRDRLSGATTKRVSVDSSTGGGSSRPRSFVQNGDEFVFKSSISPSARSNSVPEHKFKFSSSTEINNNSSKEYGGALQRAAEPDLAATTTTTPIRRHGSFRSSASLIFNNSPSPRSANSSASGATDHHATSAAAAAAPHTVKSPTTKFSFKTPEHHNTTTTATITSPGQARNLNLWDPGVLLNDTPPIIMQQGSRSRGASKKLNAFSPEEEYSKVHIKKVWSPQSPPPVFDAALENGVPSTDPELRKAYFRQLEEINSLKDQLSLKDKRIRQLEDELRLLRPITTANEMGESTC